MNPTVDVFIHNSGKWKSELETLRKILLGCQLIEEVKWGVPCYTYRNGNIAGINGLKDYCTLAFFKGALLKDTESILVKPGKNTQTGRWVKFTGVDQINQMAPVLKEYIREALEIEDSGVKVKLKSTSDFEVPVELEWKFEERPDIKVAFDALTPGRQRSYLLYFAAAKQSKTREARIDKHLQHILQGKGLNEL